MKKKKIELQRKCKLKKEIDLQKNVLKKEGVNKGE